MTTLTQPQIDVLSGDVDKLDADAASFGVSLPTAPVRSAIDALRPPVAPPQPAIASFTATPPSITAGQSATLAATFSNGTATLDGAAWDGSAKPVTPGATQTYQLVVTGAAGTTPATSALTLTVTPVVVVPPPSGAFKSVTRSNVAPSGAAYWEPPEGTGVHHTRVDLHASGSGYNQAGVDLIGAQGSNSGDIFTAVGDLTMGINDNMPFLFNVGKMRYPGLAWNDPNYYIRVQPRAVVFNGSTPIQTEWFGYEHLDPANPTAPKRAHAYDVARLDAMMGELTNPAKHPYVDRNRIALRGESMGALGAAFYGLRHEQYFCVLLLDMPMWYGTIISDWENKTWSGNYPTPGLMMADGVTTFAAYMDSVAWINNHANKIPPVVTGIGRQDAYSPWDQTVAAWKALLARDDTFVSLAWTDNAHASQPRLESLLTYKQEQFVKGVGFPILRRSSLDTGSLGDGTLAGSSTTGKVNDGFKWRVVSETATGLSLALSNTLGGVTVDVRPSSTIFPCAGVPYQTVTIPPGGEVTVNFDVPSTGAGGPVGGGVPTALPMTMGGHRLVQLPALVPAGSLEEGAKALNLGHIVTMWHHYNQDRYQRKQWHVTLTREGVWCWNTLLKLGAGDTFALDFCSANIAAGGPRIPFDHPVYALTFNGVELARTTVAPGSNQATFKGALGTLVDDWYRLDIVPLNADGTPGHNVYDQQGNPAGESHVPFWIVVDRNGTAKDLPYAVKQNGSWDWGQKQAWSWWQKVPKALIASRAPALTTSMPAPFSTALPSSQITRFDQQPANDADDMDVYLPCTTLRGITIFANLQHYFMEEYINAVPRVPLLDGPRGVCTTSHALELKGGRNGKWYGFDKWGYWVRYADGSKRTIFGVRHKYAAYWEELDHLGFDHPATEFVGHGDPSLQPHEQHPQGCWGFDWLKSTTAPDLTATPIKDAISAVAETPHPGDVVAFATDLRGWVWRIAHNGRDHTVPCEARIFFRCEQPWGLAEVNGVLYVSHLSRISKWDAITGAYLGDLVKNPSAALVGDHAPWQQFVYNPGQDVGTARAHAYLAWEGLRYQDGYLYGGSFAQQQANRIEIATAKIEVCQRITISDGNNHFISTAVSDGSFGPAGTIFLTTFTNTYFGRPIAYVPSAGVAADGTPLTHATRWDYHGWEWGPVRGQGKTQAQVYSTASAVANGMLATTAATLGFDVFMQKAASAPVVNLQSCIAGRAKFRAAGGHFRYGPNANGFVRMALPLGADPDVDEYLRHGCGHEG